MTDRERWIVYPLLFLSLGTGLRDKLINRTTSRSIICQELIVVDEDLAGQRAARVLAKIGRSEPENGSAPRGHLIVNGGVSVVNEEDLGGRKSLHPLAKLGRDEPSSPLIAGRGLLYVDGLANVDGQMFVNGLINAQGYAYQGVPIIPSFQPGVSLESVLRAMQQAMGRGRNADTARPDSPAGDGGGSEAGKDERPAPAREPVQQPAETPDRVPADRGD